jgi:DNA-binding winged helix-turn-helix (wHTH) protein
MGRRGGRRAALAFCRRDGEHIHLTRLEYRLLEALIRAQGKVMTHQQILREIWGDGFCERIYYSRVYMMNLRQKLEENPTQPQHLITELQVGYRLVGAEIVQASPQVPPAKARHPCAPSGITRSDRARTRWHGVPLEQGHEVRPVGSPRAR